MRVLHLPTAVGGNAWGLAQGEKALGLESEVLVATDTWLGYNADIVLDLAGVKSRALKLARLAQAFMKIRARYDVFHFNFGSSLIHSPLHWLNQLELPFYRDDAKLFVTYNGCDARQKYPTMQRASIAACHNPRCYGGACNSGKLDEARRAGIEKMARYARHMWALNPDLLYFLPPEKSSFLPYSVLPERVEPAVPTFEGPLKVLHAPTNREAKGSDHVFAAVESIRETHGDVLQLMVVENVRHEQALELYRRCDLVVDQVLIGWYGGLAVEAMRLGKPVISRIAREDLHFLPAGMAEDVQRTLINADPSTLREVLLRCIDDRAGLRERAEAGLEYVRKWHDPVYVASITKEKYETE